MIMQTWSWPPYIIMTVTITILVYTEKNICHSLSSCCFALFLANQCKPLHKALTVSSETFYLIPTWTMSERWARWAKYAWTLNGIWWAVWTVSALSFVWFRNFARAVSFDVMHYNLGQGLKTELRAKFI